MAATQQYSLRWNNYFRHLTYALDNHRTDECFVDVSLCCDGRKIKAHKVVLSSCSSYFKEIFKENPHPHPVIIFKFIKFEDLNSIIEFMYQGEVNVQQEALQSFLQTAELLAVQGLTAEEKEKPKVAQAEIDDHKLIKTIPSTIRINETVTGTPIATQTIEIPATGILQQPQQHHVQTQIQHIQVQPQQAQAPQQQLQQAATHQQQQQQQLVTTASATVTLPVPITSSNTLKKRKITFSSDDENIYTTETVDYAVKEEAIVKSADMSFLRGTVKMDIPEYIVSEVEDSQQMGDSGTQQGTQDTTSATGQNVTQYTSEYEILTEAEIDEKYQQSEAENAIEIGHLLNTSSGTSTATTNAQGTLDETGGSDGDGGGSAVKTDHKSSSTGELLIEIDSLICKVCNRRLQSLNALRRHIASRHTQISGREFQCSICHKSFKTKWSLSTHNSRFHRDMRPTRECVKIEFS